MENSDILPAPVIDIPGPVETKWERERKAFARLLPELLPKCRDKYVAIHEEHVVETGDTLVEVAERAYARLGYIPIYVGLVAEQPLRRARIPSPRSSPPKSRSNAIQI